MSPLLAHLRRLQKLLRRRGQGKEDAEDLVQEAFVRLQQYCNEGNEVRSTEAFLTRTALNLAINTRETGRNAHAHEEVDSLTLIDLSPTPDEVFAAEECLRQVEGLLRGVSRRTRDIFFMHRLEGLSYLQIAEHFDVSVSAVEKHVASATAVLAPHMRKELKRQ